MRALALCCAFFAACGPGNRKSGDDAQGGVCTEGTFQCDASTWQTCQGGMWVTSVDCPVACADGIGCVQCTPGSMTCMNGDVYGCDANGNPSGLIQQCMGNQLCDTGVCVDACAAAATNRSYVGCEYWAVDLDNAYAVVDLQSSINCAFTPGVQNVTIPVCYNANDPNVGGPAVSGTCDPPSNSCPTGYSCSSQAVCVLDAQHAPFGIVVSNPQGKSTDVTVTAGNGATFTTTVQAGTVVPLMPQMNSIPDQSIDGTELVKQAYKVTSTLPIVAYQFNPLNNSNVFSNDASLLIPRTAWDIDYYGLAWPTSDNRAAPTPNLQPWWGYITVVSYQDGTVVEVTPTAAVQASATMTSMPAGTKQTFTLNAFQVLNLEATANGDLGDLTGSIIHSKDGITPIGVFGGQEAAYFGESTPPDSSHTAGPCCADHLEEMLFPNSTWGKTFAIARTKQRLNEPDYIRVMAQKAGTSVTFNPSPSATVTCPAGSTACASCANLGPGQFCDVKIQGDTSITANQPVLVGHYIESAIWQDPLFGDSVPTDPTMGGDPSMAIAVPVEQYRTGYTLLIPMAYAHNFLSISAPPTGAVVVDGNTQTMTNFAANAYRSTIVEVMAGQHTIQCPGTCGVLVYGYDNAVSYMFAGGLDLKQIVVQ